MSIDGWIERERERERESIKKDARCKYKLRLVRWELSVADGTNTIAPLVVARRETIESALRARAGSRKAAKRMEADQLAECLCECLPELRRDYLLRVVRNFGVGDISTVEFFRSCTDAYVETLRKQSALAKAPAADSSERSVGLGRAAKQAVAANSAQGARATPKEKKKKPPQQLPATAPNEAVQNAQAPAAPPASPTAPPPTLPERPPPSDANAAAPDEAAAAAAAASPAQPALDAGAPAAEPKKKKKWFGMFKKSSPKE